MDRIKKSQRLFIRSAGIVCLLIFCFFDRSFPQMIEDAIRSGKTSTVEQIVAEHPRLWIKGARGWDKDHYGSFAWRIIHGPALKKADPANDQHKYEFFYTTCGIDYGADYMFENYSHDYSRRFLEPIIAGKAVKLNWKKYVPVSLPGTSTGRYSPEHTADDYFNDARKKLLFVVKAKPREWIPQYVVLYGSAAYDWLVTETNSNGDPVLNNEDRDLIRDRLLVHADYLKDQVHGKEHFFQANELSKYFYVVVGLVLYEPSLVGDTDYATINAKAKSYLDDFDDIWIGKILPALNKQGADGGWHGGLTHMRDPMWISTSTSYNSTVIPEVIAPVLFGHYTATDIAIEHSVFSSSFMKYFVEFQNYMILPGENRRGRASYYAIGGEAPPGIRTPWSFPTRMYSRRRFSQDPEQQKLAELGAWIRLNFRRQFTLDFSWNCLDFLLFADKWKSPRSPAELGYDGTKHFDKLGWIFMRTGFTNPNDLAALFICQPYHWSHMDPYSQNSLSIEKNGPLIEGFQNTILIDNKGQRKISTFPTMKDGVDAYRPGSIYDVGPGIVTFENHEQYAYLYGDATNAYDKNKLTVFTRQLVYIKPDIFVLFDRVVTSSSAISTSWVIDPVNRPEMVQDRLFKISNHRSALWLKCVLPRDIILKHQTENTFEIQPQQNQREQFFLHVFQIVDTNLPPTYPHLVADDVLLIENENDIGVKIKQKQILFDRQGDPAIHVTFHEP